MLLVRPLVGKYKGQKKDHRVVEAATHAKSGLEPHIKPHMIMTIREDKGARPRL
jgi:hypothetical protein